MYMQNVPRKKDYILSGILAVGVLGGVVWNYTFGFPASVESQTEDRSGGAAVKKQVGLEENVLPSGGVELPVVWGDLGVKMASVGVVDAEKFAALYERRGGLDEETKQLLYGTKNGRIKITRENSGVILNLFWALGLGQKSSVLDRGEMMDPSYGGADRFASTGGWTLAQGDAMDYYSRHKFFELTDEQMALVDRVSKNIYRPCCGNSTHFPDCNHGMAMLGLLELMASQGIGEDEMYRVALAVNSYWFPDTYITIAKYFENRGIAWTDIDPKTVLGSAYSSGQGYQQILKEVEPPEESGGGGCGV